MRKRKINKNKIKGSEYALNALKAAKKYEEDILNGTILANTFIIQAVNRNIKLRKVYYYDESEVLSVFKFMSFINLTLNGKVSRMEIMPWQAWVILSIYSLYRDNDLKKRLIREVIIYVARKCGKSSLSAILGLYEMLKGERNPEVYVVSATQNQAGQVFKYWGQMINDSPSLKKRLVKRQYHIQTDDNGIGIAKAEVNEPERLNGKNVSLGIVDEAAILPNKDLYQVLQTGTVQRINPLMIQITTASMFKEYYFYNDLAIAKKVLNEELKADNTFYAIYQLEGEHEIDNADNWVKAMPAIGTLIDKEDIKVAWEKAQLTLTDKIDFKVKHFNLYQDNDTTWIPDEDYRKCFIDPDLERLKGCKAYIGLDLSSVRDLTSLVLVVENPETGILEVIPRFFFPTENTKNKIRKTGIDLTTWIKKGYITEHKAKVVDYHKIVDEIKYYDDFFDLQGVSYDKWNSATLMADIEAEIMIDLHAAPQSASYFNAPLKYLERLVYSKSINLSTNPVLRWNFRNVVLYTDGNGNIKIVKNKSKDSVDGAVALGMAIGLYMKLNWNAVELVMNDITNTNK